MPLDDFFAKRGKKKIKKQNPESLMRKLMNDTTTSSLNDTGPVSDQLKVSSLLKDDEWEIIDEGDREIDLESIRINKLSVDASDDPSKANMNDKTEEEANSDEPKKAWAPKPVEPAVIAPVPEEPTPAEPQAPRTYVPIHLRTGPMKPKAAKPDVSSVADFPTLDAAVAPEVPGQPTSVTSDRSASKLPDNKLETSINEEDGWKEAGASRKVRLPEQSTTPSQVFATSSFKQNLTGSPAPSQLFRGPRMTEERHADFSRASNGPSFSRGSAGDDGWSRGNTISSNPNVNTSFPSRFDSKQPAPSPLRPSASSWERGSNVKVFKDSVREKVDFALPQSNRFAGLNET